MYAVVALKGQQFRVEPGTILDINRVDGEAGDTFTVPDSVLMAKDDDGIKAGAPILPGSSVELEIVQQFRDKKIVVFKMKRRKHYRRKQGHRQSLTKVLVKDIKLG